MIVLGIDPGTIAVGYCVLQVKSKDNIDLVTSGTICAKSNKVIHKRLGIILQNLETIIQDYSPDIVSLEKSFYHKNARTTIALGEARGVVLSLVGKYNIELKEFTPTSVKKSVTGVGNSDKDRMQKMVKMILGQDLVFKDDNQSDAVAIALCCVYRSFGQFNELRVRGFMS